MMGTRASFWLGDPRDVENRVWLGCIAWDGYPDGFDRPLEEIESEEDFKAFVDDLKSRDDFAHPEKGWPFPWPDDIFLTDFTYAWIDDAVHYSCFYKGMLPLPDQGHEEESWVDDPSCLGVPAPDVYNPGQPDSIMIIERKGS